MKKALSVFVYLLLAVSLLAVPASAEAQLPTYDANADFSQANEGPVWFYEATNAQGEWERVTTYEAAWDGWYGSWDLGGAGVYVGGSKSGLTPMFNAATGIYNDASFKFVCPETGKITIPASRLTPDPDHSEKGVVASILHNDEVIWSTDFDKSGVDKDGKDVPEQKLSVRKGDVIRFRGHSKDTAAGNNGNFRWEIKVNYTSVGEDITGGTTSGTTGGTTAGTTAGTTDGTTSATTGQANLPVYKANQDFNSSNAGPVWFYEVTNGEGAWEKATEYHEEWDGFLCIGAYANAGVYGGASCSGLAPSFDAATGVAHDACFKFVCPESGNITIPSAMLKAKSDPSAKGAVVSILHNDKEIWSTTFDKSGADAEGKAVPEQKLTVKKGDVIRFKAHSLDTTAGNNGSFEWDIQVAYTASAGPATGVGSVAFPAAVLSAAAAAAVALTLAKRKKA